LKKKITLKDYFCAVILKKSIGNSYWFSFAIISFYIEAFFAFILIRNKKFNFIGIIFLTIICYFHVKYVHKYYYPKEPVFNLDTVMCFIPGLYYSFFQSYLDKIIMFNDIIYLGFMSIVIYFYYKYHLHPKEGLLLYRSIKNCIFCLVAVLLTMKIQLKNDFLKFLNSHSYSIYLLQRIVFMYFREKGILNNNAFIRFFFQFSLILLISCIFDRITIYIDILFKKRTKKKNANKANNKIKMIELS
jgi:peptidoglycan/LPS O-acetylase OafA/YrhL